ncbi:MAG: polysaccharide biosynthesis protein [Fusicatenibacter sp.]|nr:polysaccharide biosynthesis protein [Lachnospiraceae bacterium]MDY2937691.1 polysaccharide biosynthesis protein [Fusicatenibacter sp.]
MSKKKALLVGTFTLTFAGLLSRLIGFFYRIFLSQMIGAEELGIFQLITPVYALMLSVCTGGIQTSLSRFIAACTASGDTKKARTYLFTGTLTASVLSLISGILLYYSADLIGCKLLLSQRTVPILRVIAFGIFPASIHSCLTAWYFGQNRTVVPSICQLLEQSARTAATYAACRICLMQGTALSASIAAIGTLAGELVSSIVTSLFLLSSSRVRQKDRTFEYHFRDCFVPLMEMALPLTLNRIFINLLHGIESVLIPGRLQVFGLTSKEALETLGILTGMALPMIFFPSTITHAVSVMLLPDIAKDQAAGRKESILITTEKTIKYCMVLGIYAAGAFFFYGPDMGLVLFKNKQAGTFLRILSFLSPFLYLEATLTSILNGLGKTSLVFLQNSAGLVIRILFIFFLIPERGIVGYLYGILASELTITLMNLSFLRKEIPFHAAPFRNLLLPAASIIVSLTLTRAFFVLLSLFVTLPALPALILPLLLSLILYLSLLYPLISSGNHLFPLSKKKQTT